MKGSLPTHASARASRLVQLCFAVGCASESPKAEEPPPTTEASGDSPQKTACLQLRASFRDGECRGVLLRTAALECRTAPPDDPACTELGPLSRRCEDAIHDYSTAHSPFLPGGDPSTWTCDEATGPGERRARPPAVEGELLFDIACDRTYAHLRGFPAVDRATLERTWRSSACRERVRVVHDALSDSAREGWARRWAWPPDEGGTASWIPTSTLGADEYARVLEALASWCGSGPACTVLGRCDGVRLPNEHPTFPGAFACVARSDEDCRAAQACAVEGRCRMDARTGACVPGSDDDCARSEICSTRGACRRVAGRPVETASCGGTTPATSGADIIGFVGNPVLAGPPPRLETVAASVAGPHARVLHAFSGDQRGDIERCVAVALSAAPRMLGTLHVDVVLEDGIATRAMTGMTYVGSGGGDRLVDGREVLDRCLARALKSWTIPRTAGRSMLSLEATIEPR